MTLDQRPRALAQRYLLRDRLDRGTDEEIWRAQDDVLGREVAVAFVDTNGAASSAEHDLIAAARLSDASVERILDAGTDGETARLFVVTEFVPGETLRAALDRDGPLEPGRAASIVSAVLTALACGHRLGVAHGRVAPEQVILGIDGRVRLAGFGRPTRSGATPEGDVRAAAALLFETLTGTPPPEGPPAPSARTFRAGIPRELDEATRRVLASDAAGAPGAEELRASLQRFATAPSREDREVVMVPEKASSFFRSWMLVPILLIVGVGVAIGIGLALGRLEVGGPLGIEPKTASTSAAPSRLTTRLPIRSVRAYDPYGDGSEDDEEAALAADGDTATWWHTENYFDGTLTKPGVGLLLDLGGERSVSQIRVLSPVDGFRFQIGVGDSATEARQAISNTYVAGRTDRISVTGTGRYVLVWCTSVVPTGDGDRAVISEVEVAGPR